MWRRQSNRAFHLSGLIKRARRRKGGAADLTNDEKHPGNPRRRSGFRNLRKLLVLHIYTPCDWITLHFFRHSGGTNRVIHIGSKRLHALMTSQHTHTHTRVETFHVSLSVCLQEII